MDPRFQPGFLGTGASLMSDLSLLAYILLIVPGIVIGLWLARRGKHRPHHKWLMILITVVNWALILFLMVVAYASDIDDHILEQPDNMRYLIPTIHGLFGLPAQILATYIIYRMLREDTQVAAAKRRGETGNQLERYWFSNAKPIMRLTLTLWLVTAAFGVITYLVRYDVMPVLSSGSQDPPAATPELTPEATGEMTPAVTPEVEETPDSTSEPVETPEMADRPVVTPEAQEPVMTPEIAADLEPDDDDSGRGRGRGRGRGGSSDDDDPEAEEDDD